MQFHNPNRLASSFLIDSRRCTNQRSGEMQRLTALLVRRTTRTISQSKRTICSQSQPSEVAASAAAHPDEEVLVEGKAHSRTAVLNRPSVLNALNANVGIRLKKLYKNWEDDPNISTVMIKGRGRAFCAGGDIVALYHLIREGNMDYSKEFFRELYTFIYILGTFMKPQVALLNGITMGGGGGVSIPGLFRVATDKTVFATPETLIGFHPDAGASFYLSHLPGHLGEYLALTGEKLTGAEMVSCGLATHYALSARLPDIEEHLGQLVTNDPTVIESDLGKFSDHVTPDTMSVLRRIETVDKCFNQDSVEEIIAALENERGKTDHAWCASILKRLREVSPLSLKVSLKSVREGRFQTLDQCLAREYRMSLQGITGKISTDFSEGVRARMVDRDFKPKWDPPSLNRVSDDMVDEYFSPLSKSEPELELPTKVREAFA